MAARVQRQWQMVGVTVILFCCWSAAQDSTNHKVVPLNQILDGLEKTQASIRPPFSYQVVREYRLSGDNDAKSDSEVVAEVDFRPPASKEYRIQKSSGSSRGQQIVRRVLDHEVENASRTNQSQSLITRNNYDFTYLGDSVLDGRPCYMLGLKPKRKEKELVAGAAWVDKSSFVVRQIEGEVAKTPSWWLKTIYLKITFSEIEGAWLQTSLKAVADVRIAGPHTLTSRMLDYRGADEVATVMRPRPAANKQSGNNSRWRSPVHQESIITWR